MQSLALEVVTRDCKERLCPEEAEDSRGRYAGLCRIHKAEAVAAMRVQQTGTPRPRSTGELAAVAAELGKQARRVDRASKKLELERAELRKVYLRFGLEAGFLNPRPQA